MTLDKIDMNTDTEQVQKLPEQLTRVGNQYRIFKRGQQTLVYSEVNSAGKNLTYEVFQIRIQKAGEMFGTWYPDREKFPGSEDFGKWAVWCHNLEKALQWFDAFEHAEKGSGYNDLRGKVNQSSIQGMKPITTTLKTTLKT